MKDEIKNVKLKELTQSENLRSLIRKLMQVTQREQETKDEIKNKYQTRYVANMKIYHCVRQEYSKYFSNPPESSRGQMTEKTRKFQR